MSDYDDTCVSCKKGYNFEPETVLYLYLGQLSATNVAAKCPHCQAEYLIFVSYDKIMAFAEHEAIKVLVYYNPTPDIAERAEKVRERYRQSQELPELPREMARELYDTLRAFGGES
jgi:hypothetical protein